MVDGTLLIFIESDPYARYYVLAPDGPNGERTVTYSYKFANGSVDTAYFYVTGVAELQICIGDDAVVYAVDDVNGRARVDTQLSALTTVPERSEYSDLFETFVTR